MTRVVRIWCGTACNHIFRDGDKNFSSIPFRKVGNVAMSFAVLAFLDYWGAYIN